MKKQRKFLVTYIEMKLIRILVAWFKKAGYIVYICHTNKKSFISSSTLLLKAPSKPHSYVNFGLAYQN